MLLEYGDLIFIYNNTKLETYPSVYHAIILHLILKSIRFIFLFPRNANYRLLINLISSKETNLIFLINCRKKYKISLKIIENKKHSKL